MEVGKNAVATVEVDTLKLRSLIVGTGFSPSDAANKAGIAPATMSRLCRGYPCRVKTLHRLASVFNVPARDLLKGSTAAIGANV